MSEDRGAGNVMKQGIKPDFTAEREKFVLVNGIKIYYVDAGAPHGDPVLFLHGFPEVSWAWHDQMEALGGQGFRCCAIDMRGYGLSDAPQEVAAYRIPTLVADVIGIADALGWQRFFLVGHDWGGIIAWAAAAGHPQRIAKLAILNAPHPDVLLKVMRKTPSQILRSAYIGFFQMPWVPEAALSFKNYALLRKSLVATSRPGTFDHRMLERFVQEWQRSGRLRAMLNYYRALRHKRDALPHVAVPTLILWGLRDAALHSDLAHASLRHCDAASLHFHAEASHWLHHEEPAWVDDHLGMFFSGIQASDGKTVGMPNMPRAL